MRLHGIDRIGERGSILDLQPVDRVRIVAAPDFRLVIQHGRIIPPASAAAAAEQHLGMLFRNLLQDPVQSQHVPVHGLALALPGKKAGPNVGDTAVHIPFQILDPGIGQQRIQNAGQISADVLPGQIQDQLVPSSAHGPSRRPKAPFRMGPVKLAVLGNHFRLDPDAELKSHFMDLFR